MDPMSQLQSDVTEIKRQVESTAGAIESINHRLSTLTEGFDTFKNGAPGSDTPGIVVRVDRMERVQNVLIWAATIVGGALLVSFVGALSTVMIWVVTEKGP